MADDTQPNAHLDELKQLHETENQLLQFLPRMAGAVVEPELRDAFAEQIAVTRRMVEQLDVVLTDLGISREKATSRPEVIAQAQNECDLNKTAEFDLSLMSVARRLDSDELAEVEDSHSTFSRYVHSEEKNESTAETVGCAGRRKAAS